MNRSMLLLRIAAKWHVLNVKVVEAAVSAILSALSTRLAVDGRVEIRGFHSFWVGYRPPRIGHTPKTGVKVDGRRTGNLQYPAGDLVVNWA